MSDDRVNLFESFCAAEFFNGKSQKEMIDDFNEATGMAIDRSRLHDWRVGKSFPHNGGVAYNYIISIVIPHLTRARLSVHYQNKLLAHMSFPEARIIVRHKKKAKAKKVSKKKKTSKKK